MFKLSAKMCVCVMCTLGTNRQGRARVLSIGKWFNSITVWDDIECGLACSAASSFHEKSLARAQWG